MEVNLNDNELYAALDNCRPKVKFVKTDDRAVLPKFNIEDPITGDIGADLFATEARTIPARSSCVVPVGLKVGFISPGYYFIIAPRSGLAFKHGITPHQGRIDNQYRGDLGVKLFNLTDVDYEVNEGDKIAQIEFHVLVQPEFSWIKQEEVVATVRNEGGFGSSGK